MIRASVAQSRQEHRQQMYDRAVVEPNPTAGWWRTQGVGVLTLALLLFGLGGVAVAQGPTPGPTSCSAIPACYERLVDLREYRDYLEDTLASCKAANKSLSATLSAKQQELEALKKTLPSEEPRK